MKWKCMADSLVTDDLFHYEVEANCVAEAQTKAYMIAEKSRIMDCGSIDFKMDTEELANHLYEMSMDMDFSDYEDTRDFEVSELVKELDNLEVPLRCCLESIVCNYAQKGGEER